MRFKIAVINARTGADQRAIASEYIVAVAAQGCRLACFPEGFLCLMPQGQPVFCPVNSAPVNALADIARAQQVAVLTGMWELDGDQRYLSALYIDTDGRPLIIHRKTIPTVYEKRKGVTAGHELRVHQTAFGTIGASLCLENWSPDIPRTLALAGAELIYAPSYLGMSVPGRFDYYDSWKQMLRVRAMENICYVVACTNTIARRPLGLVVDCDGHLVVEREIPGIAVAVVDLDEVRLRRQGKRGRGIVPPLRLG